MCSFFYFLTEFFVSFSQSVHFQLSGDEEKRRNGWDRTQGKEGKHGRYGKGNGREERSNGVEDVGGEDPGGRRDAWEGGGGETGGEGRGSRNLGKQV